MTPSGRSPARCAASSTVTTEVERAERAAAALFGEDIVQLDEKTLLDVVDDAPTTLIGRDRLVGGVPLVDVFVTTGLVKSKGEARRAITQGGAYVNNRRADDVDQALGADDLLHGRYVVLRRGRRDYHLLQAE